MSTVHRQSKKQSVPRDSSSLLRLRLRKGTARTSRNDAGGLLAGLNPEQVRAVTHHGGPLLIVAGAGTGKTTVIAKRIAWLVQEQGIAADRILALTFTEKAAMEMEERVDRLLPMGYVTLWISTFHGFCERVLRDHALDIGLPNDARLLDDTAAWLRMRQHLDRFALDYYRPRGNPTKFLHALHRHFSRCKDEAVSPAEYIAYAKRLRLDGDDVVAGRRPRPSGQAATAGRPYEESEITRIEELANAYHIYQQLLLEHHEYDFGDLLSYTLELLRTRPHILAQYRAKFPHVLVDEFQDTNWAQYEIVKLLASPTNNLTVVGDDDQSVYAFRGAAMSNILHFKEDYPKATECVLTTNYRSRQEILDAAYTLIQQNNPARLETTLKINKRLVGAGGSGGSVRVLHAADASGEAQMIAAQIHALHDTDGVAWGDIAILSRANSHAEQILPALHAAGIPYLHLASRGLYRTEPVLDILAYLALLDDVHEGPAMYRVLSMSLWGIPYDDLLRLTTWAHRGSHSLYDACRQARAIEGMTAASADAIDRICTMIAKHTELARRAPAHDVVLAFLEESKYLRDISDEETVEDHAAVAILNAFWKRMERFEAGADAPTVKEFMATIALERQAGELGAMPPDPQAGPDAVRVLTVHAAKGLEFRHVFVINMVELRFPSADRGEPIELPDALTKVILPEGDIHIQEERRLCYVAATRAKEGLWWTYADDYGGARARKPSRFLAELGTHLPAVAATFRSPSGRGSYSICGDLKVAATTPFHALPTHLSYTHLKDYETCPWMYHYRHVLKIPIPMRDKGAISFGKTIHNTLEHFFKRVLESRNAQQEPLLPDVIARSPRAPSRSFRAKGGRSNPGNTGGDEIACASEQPPPLTPPARKQGENHSLHRNDSPIPPLTDLLAIYEQEWIGDWYLDAKHRDEAKARGKEFLRGFYEQHARDGWPDVRAVEQPFTFKVGDVSVTGSIDRVDNLPDGTVALVDYKTGKRPTRFSTEEKRQLFVYQIAAQSLGLTPSILLYTYFDGEAPASFIGADKDLDATRDAFRDAYDGIRAQQFDATPSPDACNWCEYRSICPYSQATR